MLRHLIQANCIIELVLGHLAINVDSGIPLADGGPPSPVFSFPPPGSAATRGIAAALPSCAVGCPSPGCSWGPPSKSLHSLGSIPPWAAPTGTLGMAAQFSGTALATPLGPGLPCGAPGGPDVAMTLTPPDFWSGLAAGSGSPPPLCFGHARGVPTNVPFPSLALAPTPAESPYLRPYGPLVV